MILTLDVGVKTLLDGLNDMGIDPYAFSHHAIFSYKTSVGTQYGFMYLDEDLQWNLAFVKVVHRAQDVFEMTAAARLAIEEFREKNPTLEYHLRDSMKMIADARDGTVITYTESSNGDETFEVVYPDPLDVRLHQSG